MTRDLVIGMAGSGGDGIVSAGESLIAACATEGYHAVMNLLLLPMWLLSGVFFSYERFGRAARPFIEALPLTQLLIGLRAVVLEEGWELAGIGAQVVDYIQRECFDDLDAPVVRVHQADVPMPYAKNLEKLAKPDAAKTIAAVKQVMYLE